MPIERMVKEQWFTPQMLEELQQSVTKSDIILSRIKKEARKATGQNDCQQRVLFQQLCRSSIRHNGQLY